MITRSQSTGPMSPQSGTFSLYGVQILPDWSVLVDRVDCPGVTARSKLLKLAEPRPCFNGEDTLHPRDLTPSGRSPVEALEAFVWRKRAMMERAERGGEACRPTAAMLRAAVAAAEAMVAGGNVGAEVGR